MRAGDISLPSATANKRTEDVGAIAAKVVQGSKRSFGDFDIVKKRQSGRDRVQKQGHVEKENPSLRQEPLERREGSTPAS